MGSGSNAVFSIPHFSGENHHIWAVKMRSCLKSFGLWEHVEQEKEVPELRANPTIAQIRQHEEETLKKEKAVSCLHSALADDVFTCIMHLETAKQIWDELNERYAGDERVRSIKLLTLKKEFEMLKMKETESVKEYTSKLSHLVNQMRLYGEVVDDSKVVEKMLISLPDKFEAKVAAIEESCDLKKLTVSEMVSKLQAHEQRFSMRMDDATEGAFQAKHKGKQSGQKNQNKQNYKRGGDQKGKNKEDGSSSEVVSKDKFPPCLTCKRTNHLTKNCFYKGKPQIQCNYCKRWGHREKFCRVKQNQSQPQHAHQVNFTDEQSQHEDHLFMASHECSSASKDVWYVDSGCTIHMAKEPSLFTSLDRAVRTKVNLGNGEIVQAEGRGTVSVHTSKGPKFINDVLLIPDLDQNLLSVAQLMKKGYSLSFKNNGCVIMDSNDCEVVNVEMCGNSFPISLNQVNQTALVSKHDDSALWHKRYGHFNMNALKFLQSHDMVRDMPPINCIDDLCNACQLGKMHRKSFQSTNGTRARNKLELVHTDLCGPMSIPSLSQNKYFILFIDDLTRMTWVYFLTSKAHTFNVFKKFRAMVESQSGCKIKMLRSDNGKEYTSNEFNRFCEDMGIVHQLTVSYTPEQNGVSERKNRTVMEMARCLIAEKKLPKSFWAEAVYTAVYLLNRLPTRAVQEKTPIEAWIGVKPSAKHLKIFGSICYVHVPAAKRSKLDDKAEMGIFLGYASSSKGYRVYNLKTKQIVISRDLDVDENTYWNWENNEVQKCELKSTSGASDNQQHAANGDEYEIAESDSPVLKTKSLAEIYENCNFVVNEPSCFEEASMLTEWKDAMKEELLAINKNGTWELTSRPKDKNVIGVKWVYRTKLNPDGSIHKHKARLVVKGYSQMAGVDYGDTFAPVARHETIRLIVALSAHNGWKIFHLDVKSAFLNGVLQEEIYVEQPAGFVISGHEDKVYRLHKALYGLKQAPRAWYSRIDSHFLQNDFKRSQNEPTLYVKDCGNEKKLIVSLYVDDLLVTGDDIHVINNFKKSMLQAFEMTDLGEMKYFLGMELHQHDDGIFISQSKYANDVLKKFKLESCKPVSTPLAVNEKLSKVDGDDKADVTQYRSLIGCLLYLTATRPDLMFSASLLSRFMHSPSVTHFGVGKRVLRYIKGTSDFGIWYSKSDGKLEGFVDSDWAGSVDDSKSTTGYVFSLGSGVFSWNSKKQDVVAQSSAEAE
ncbi:putative mitochondrial protein [Trifolium repens]|nr:putative mitochondrial protein [Trifolium repens]